MASAELNAASRPAWAPGDPWCWMAAGASMALAAFLWTLLPGKPLPVVRFSLVVVGLLIAAGGLWIGMRRSVAVLDSLPTARRSSLLLTLVLFDVLCAGAASALLLTYYLGRKEVPWSFAALWLIVAPWCLVRASWLWKRRQQNRPLSSGLELSYFWSLFAVTAFLACGALFRPDNIEDCDSLRLLLAAAALVGFLASPLAAASRTVRRVAISLVLLLHFGGIVTAVTGSQPGPWLSSVAWVYFYEPYLEFMFLNNAYRFYAPEPAASTQLWFSIEYKDSNNQLQGTWDKLPKMDNRGRSRYRLDLQFQRRLSLTEHVTNTVPTPPALVRDATGKLVPADYYKRRDDNSPNPEHHGIFAAIMPANPKGIPYHPDPSVPQYSEPGAYEKQMFQSYARFVMNEHRDLKPIRVKIYRVLHRILPPEDLARGADPQEWTNFLPYYMGAFNADGRLLDPQEPFLYWILPSIPEDWNDPQSKIKVYAYFHAGDTDWVKTPRTVANFKPPMGP